VTDLVDVPVEDLVLDEDIAIELSEDDATFVDDVVKKCILFTEEFCQVQFFPYQTPIAYRLIESLVIGDGEEMTLIATRQSGKSEVLADVIAGMMVLFPKLAQIYPKYFGKFADGFLVGVFAPIEDQADTIFGRVVSKLTSDHATDMLLDPELDDLAKSGGTRGKGKIIVLKNNHSHCRMQSCNPQAKIESKTYHFIVVDEAHDADEVMVAKSIKPMLAFNNGSIVLAGTAQRKRCYFLKMINYNKRRHLNARRGSRQCHFEYDYKTASRYNKNYAAFIAKEKVRLGEDSDEFRMSYCNSWLLEKGMFVSEDRLETLYDPSMEVVRMWKHTGLIAGLDVARTNDSTVLTVLWVDWDHPDPFGFFEHRVLDWLELNNTEWESQYFEIAQFLSNYAVFRMGVDAQGVGGAVAERLQILLPHIEVIAVDSGSKAQNERWTHLTQLMQRRQMLFPGHSKARRLRRWKRFNHQMLELEKVQRGPYLLAEAPNEKDAYDDYPDSLAIGCSMSLIDSMPVVQQYNNLFYDKSGRR
jgi:hypothetical protein